MLQACVPHNGMLHAVLISTIPRKLSFLIVNQNDYGINEYKFSMINLYLM